MSRQRIVFASVTLSLGMHIGGVFIGRAAAQMPNQPMGNQPATARPAIAYAPGTRFQYKCFTDQPERIWKDDAQDVLNKMGAQGWRLLDAHQLGITANKDVYCFERAY
jgi:hypothetical protein